MKKTKLTLFYLLFITIIAFSGCQESTNQSAMPAQTQQRLINKAEAVKIAEKFIADQKSGPIGEVFSNASGVKFINKRWFIGFTYLSHFQEEELKVVSMDIDGSNLKVEDHVYPQEDWLNDAQSPLKVEQTNKDTPETSLTLERVEQIRKMVEQINKDTTYTTKTLKNDQFLEHMTDNGGILTGYFKNGQLVKIVEEVGLSSCTTIYEYYLHNEVPFFIYGQEKDSPYVESIGAFDYSADQIVAMESRLYFEDGKLIKSIFNGKARCSFQPSDSQVPDLLANNKKYLKLLKK